MEWTSNSHEHAFIFGEKKDSAFKLMLTNHFAPDSYDNSRKNKREFWQ